LLRLRNELAGLASSDGVFDLWNQHLGSAVALVSAHTVRLVLECFGRALDEVEDVRAHAVLDRLLRLFALSELSEFATDLLVGGLIDRDLAGRMDSEMDRIAAELSVDAELLTSAFDLPVELLDAPIGGDYLAAYERYGITEPPRRSLIRSLGVAPATESLEREA
jgi:hypothetical protein